MDPIEDTQDRQDLELHIRPDAMVIGIGNHLFTVPISDVDDEDKTAIPSSISVYIEETDGSVKMNADFINEEEAQEELKAARREAEEDRKGITTTTSINVKDFEVAAGEWLDDGDVQFLVRFPGKQMALIQRMFQRLAQYKG